MADTAKKQAWKTAAKAVICLALLCYVALAFAYARNENDSRICRDIDLRIEGNTLPDSILRQGVKAQLAKYKAPAVGAPVGKINLQKLENYLGHFSNFESVECSFNPDNRLRITIEPIRPEVRVFVENGHSYYVNRAGKRIEADAEFFIDVPVLLVSAKTEKYLPSALAVIRYAAADKELNRLISAYKIDGPNDIIMLPRIQGHVVNFGDSTRLEDKRAALLTAYRRILPAKGWNRYDTISVKFSRQIVASRRDKAISNHGSVDDDGIDLEEATLPEVADINTKTSADSNR